ncbi:hypothetical protein IID22_04220, partial [Patescibacteria group bacterium]|nr:hypothetical protein [Patescibacteria group bacterium]
MHRFKKLLISFLASIILLVSVLSSFARPVQAQGLWYSPTFDEFTNRVFDDSNPDEIFGERYTLAQVVWIFHSLTSILVPDIILACLTKGTGPGVASCLEEVISLIPFIDIGYSANGTENLANTIDSIITRNPISGIGYLKGVASRFHIIPEVSAQGGFGFGNLGALQAIWTSTRDIAYFLLIFAFIIMAFMIMFRVKISPQIVITVQSALPRLILILILITFSYAIAGFMVDLAYLVVGLFAIIIAPSTGLGALELFNRLIGLTPLFTMFLIPFIYLLLTIAFGAAAVLIPGVGFFLFLLPALVMLLLMIVFVIVWIRILWLMLRTFINVILLVIASPILILLGVFPTAGGFGSWLRNLISHLAVFPIIIFMIFLGHFFFWSTLSGVAGDTLSLIPGFNVYGIDSVPLSGPVSFPGFSLGSEVFGFVTAFGILFLIPSIGNMI